MTTWQSRQSLFQHWLVRDGVRKLDYRQKRCFKFRGFLPFFLNIHGSSLGYWPIKNKKIFREPIPALYNIFEEKQSIFLAWPEMTSQMCNIQSSPVKQFNIFKFWKFRTRIYRIWTLRTVRHLETAFTAQLVEHRTGIAEVTGSNPVEALIFLRLLLSNCLNWKIYCDDHSSLSSTNVVQIWIISYILHIMFNVSVNKYHCLNLSCFHVHLINVK